MTTETKNPSSCLTNCLFAPFALVMSTPLWLVAILGIVVITGGVFAYSQFNFDFFGLTAPPFDRMAVVGDHERISLDSKTYYTISYERSQDSVFRGFIRHVSPIRETGFPMLTHDILVTTGDFADPDQVRTSVQFHMFYWSAPAGAHPQGTINLLHIVPESRQVYSLLLQVRSGQIVEFRGREIYQINAFEQGKTNPVRWWQDHGCNSILVRDVHFLDSP